MSLFICDLLSDNEFNHEWRKKKEVVYLKKLICFALNFKKNSNVKFKQINSKKNGNCHDFIYF